MRSRRCRPVLRLPTRRGCISGATRRPSPLPSCAVPPNEFPLQRCRHRSSLRPGSGQAPPGHVHRYLAPEPPGAGGHRQRGRRGAGRPCPRHRGDAALRRQLLGVRRRPRHAGGHPPRGEDPGRRADPHAPARGRQVQQQELHLLRRPSRRRRERGQCAVEAGGSAHQARRQRVPHDLQGRRPRHAAGGRRHGRQEEHRHARAASGPMPSTSTRPSSTCARCGTCCAPRRCCAPA